MTSCRLLGNSMLLFVILGVVVVTEAQDRIKHVVVLMQENRPFDHLFGWMKGVDGLSGDEFNLVDPNDPNSLKVFVDDKAPFLNDCDPCHATPCTTQPE